MTGAPAVRNCVEIAMSITVRRVEGRRDVRRFVKLSSRLYREDPNWVAPILMDDYKDLDRSRHSFWQHAKRELYLPERDGRPVGPNANDPVGTLSPRK